MFKCDLCDMTFQFITIFNSHIHSRHDIYEGNNQHSQHPVSLQSGMLRWVIVKPGQKGRYWSVRNVQLYLAMVTKCQQVKINKDLSLQNQNYSNEKSVQGQQSQFKVSKVCPKLARSVHGQQGQSKVCKISPRSTRST